MLWWQWLVLGMLLLGAEIAIDAEFYLVFLGISAIAVGLLGASPITLPLWGQWLVFSAVSVISLVVFRSRVYDKIRGQTQDRKEGVDGEVARVDEEIAPGATGSATLRGTVWQARNVGDAPLLAGSRAIVEETEGLVISVRAED